MPNPKQFPKRLISRNPKILGGTPTISGTRFPSEKLFTLINEGYNIKEIARDYPSLTQEKIKSVIAHASKKVNGKKRP